MSQNQFEQSTVIGANVQDGVPTQQSDPTIQINTHYLPNGDMTICSDQNLDTWRIEPVLVPLTTVAGLFQILTDSNEDNLVAENDMEYYPVKYKPHNHTFMPNISHYIGMVITATELDQRYLEAILICTAGYLDGIMEILPDGTFRYLNQRRDGLNRRYSELCLVINYSISVDIYTSPPHLSTVAMEQQAIIQSLYIQGATSMRVTIKDAVINDISYPITKAMLLRWSTTIPWHALMYNSQTPLDRASFLLLFNNIYSLFGGKRLNYENSFVGDQPTYTIMPNFGLFEKLVPENMTSSVFNISTKIPERLYTMLNFFKHVETGSLAWEDDSDDESEDSDDNDGNNDQGSDNEQSTSILAS